MAKKKQAAGSVNGNKNGFSSNEFGIPPPPDRLIISFSDGHSPRSFFDEEEATSARKPLTGSSSAAASQKWAERERRKARQAKQKKPGRRPKDGCCQRPFVYYVHTLAVLLTYMCGVLFLLISCYLYILRSDYVPLLHSHAYTTCVQLMAGAGMLILVNGCLSCAAASSRCALTCYMIFLVVILAMQVVLSYLSFSYSKRADDDVDRHLPNDVLFYSNNSDIRRAIDVLQIEGRCCGSDGFEDWTHREAANGETVMPFVRETHDPSRPLLLLPGLRKRPTQYIPDSCCRSFSEGCGVSDHPSNIYYAGCLRFLQRKVRQTIYMIMTLSFSGTVIQLFAIIVTCCICCRKVRRRYRASSSSAKREKQRPSSSARRDSATDMQSAAFLA